VNAGLLDVLHHAADHDALAVADRVDVHFRGVGEEAIDEHRVLRRRLHRVLHVAREALGVVNDLHRAAA
jgi:ElaB/YqjD/DUF883 family membrane-anchored ribosome-binding protein